MDFSKFADMVMYFVIFNVSCSILSDIVRQFKDSTKSKLDNKIYSVFYRASKHLGKALDYVSANKKHDS